MEIQCFCHEVKFTIFFSKVNSLKTYCTYFRASRHLISLVPLLKKLISILAVIFQERKVEES